MSDTPETDAAEGFTGLNGDFVGMAGGGCIPIEHARKLERERDEARKVAKQILEQHPASFLNPSLKLPWETNKTK